MELTLNVGDIVQINGRHENLKREDGTDFPYVVRGDDFIRILEINVDSLLVELQEDVINRKYSRSGVLYGPFTIPLYLLKEKEEILRIQKLYDKVREV